MRDVTPEEDAILRAALRASGKVVETAATRAAVAAARAEIAVYLDMLEERAKALKAEATKQPARDFADGLIVANATAARDIRSGAPQRWAAEREGQGDG